MKINNLRLLILTLVSLLFAACSQGEKPKPAEPQELMEVTGIVSHYKNDVMYLTVLRTGMVHPLRCTDETKMNLFAAPNDTVLLVYTGYLGMTRELPVIREVHTRPRIQSGSQVVNLKDLQSNGELITR